MRVIDSCLKLHGQLCPPEMLAFHHTLETFFRKNFNDEIQRLAVEAAPLDPAARLVYGGGGGGGGLPAHLSVIERRSLEPPLEPSVGEDGPVEPSVVGWVAKIKIKDDE